MKEFLLSLSLLLFVSTVNATYIYEANQDLYDLQTNSAGSTGLGSNDDSVSAAFDLGFTFTFYGNDFTKARMATNGCLHFDLTGSYCGDYTPDPLPQYSNTLFVFWTDLIKDNGSAMKAKAFEDYTIFGWYKMREYNRSGSDNSIEVWLYPNNTFEYRYGELDIKTHDVLIGEQGPTTSDTYTYLFFDECNTGTTNQSGCKNYDWNSSSNTYNTLLENGGSLYGIGSGNALDCSSPLNNSACAGYAAAYLTQQCGIDALYSESCTLYWEAYDDLQCSLDAQYAPFCPNYTSEDSVAYYYEDETDYGYEDDYYDDQYGYTDDDYYDDVYGFEDDYQDEYYAYDDDYDDDPYANMEFTDEEWYEIDLAEFGQEQVDEWYGTEVSFDDTGLIVWEDTPLENWDELDAQMDDYDEFVEIYEDNYYEEEIFIEEIFEEVYQEETYYNEPFIEEIYEEIHYEETVAYIDYERVSDYDLYTADTLLDEFVFLENINQIESYDEEEEFLEFESYEELEEWYEEEMEEEYQEEVTMEEEYEEVMEETFEEEFEEVMEEIVEEEFEEEYLAEEIFEEEAVEEIFEELEELREEERVAEETEESMDEITEERVVQEESKSGIRQEQLNVVASTVQTATNSMSGTTSGTSIYATGNTVASGGASSSMSGTVQSTTTSSTGGMSMSSSPSISAQVQSAAIQTQTVLEMSPATSSTGSMSFDTGSMASTTTTASVVDSTSVVSTTSVDTSSSFSDSSSTSTSEDTSSQQDTQQDSQTADTTETVVASTDSSSDTSSISTSSVTMESMDTGAPVIVVDVQVQDMQNEIDTAIGGEMTASEADTVADQIIAQNIENQQEALEEEQQETGEYADSTTLIAYMGYVPGFDAYKQVSLPAATSWYEPKDIYSYVTINDNNTAFFGLYGESMQGMTKLINLQPNL